MVSTTKSLPKDSLGAKFKHRKILILFSLPFAGVGIGFLLFGIIPSIYEHIDMRGWEQGYAQLSRAGVEAHDGDDSVTYRAYASYSYEYQGHRYQGERVGIHGGSDNVTDFQKSLGKRLEQALRDGEPVTVWINPNNPSEAILNRELRFSMLAFYLIFIITFGGVGVGLLSYCLIAPINKLPADALKNVDTTNQPWLTHRNWTSAVIHSDAKSGLWFSWGFALFWNAIAIPAGVFATPEVLSGNYAAALVYMFPLVGLGLLSWALTATLRWQRFGRTPLTLDPYPGSIGGQVGGTVDIGLPFDSNNIFKATLSCLYSYMSGSGDDRERKERVVWQSEGIAYAKSWNGGTRLEILFNVEPNLPASDPQEDNSYHLWRLNIVSELEGADFDRNYEIPVFPTQQSAKLLRQLSTEHHQAAEQRLREIESVLNMEQIPGGVQIYYPAFKKPVGKLIGMVFGIFFFAAGMIAGSQGAPLIFPIVFGLIGGLIALGTLYSLVVALNVIINRQELVTKKTILGIPIGGKRIERQAIKHLRLVKSYSQSNGKKHQQFYKIQALTKDSKKIDIGFNLAGQNVGKQAMESIALLTGLEVSTRSTQDF